MSRPLEVGSLLALVAMVLSGCGVKGAADNDLNHAGRLITAEQIRDTGATNAWEAIRLTVRNYYFQEDLGQPTVVLPKRGQGSFVVLEQPLIVVDEMRINDYTVLQHIPAHQVISIRVLNHNDAATYYGLNSVAGVIVLETEMAGRS